MIRSLYRSICNLFANTRFYNIAIVVLFLGAVLIRLPALQRTLWLDEMYTLNIIQSNDFFRELVVVDHPPLYFVLIKLWSMISDNIMFLRSLSLIFDLAVIIVSFLWIRIYSKFAAALFIFVYSIFPLILRYSVELRGYSLLSFSIALSLMGMVFLFKKKDNYRNMSILALGFFMILSTHGVGVFLVFALSIFGVMIVERIQWLKIRRYLLTLCISGILYIPVHFVFFQPAIEAKDKNLWWIPQTDFDLLVKMFSKVFGLYNHHLILFLIFVIVIVILNLRTKVVRALMVSTITYWTTIIIYSVVIMPVLWYRTLLPGFTMFIALCAVSLGLINNKKIRFICLVILCLFSKYTLVPWLHKASKPVERWHEAAGIMKKSYSTGDCVIVFPHYIASLVSYYSDIPEEDMIVIDTSMVAEDINVELDELFSKLDIAPGNRKVYLFTRMDSNVKRKMTIVEEIFKGLNSEIGSPIEIRELGIVKYSAWEYLNINEKTVLE